MQMMTLVYLVGTHLLLPILLIKLINIEKINYIKLIFFWLLILFFPTKINSQNYFDVYKNDTHKSVKKTDSLLKLSKKSNQPNNYSKIAFDFSGKIYKKNILQALKYTHKALTNFETHKLYPEEYYRSIYRIGKFYYWNQEYDNAIDYYKKLIQVSKNNQRTASAYTGIARCYREKNDLFKSVEFFKKGIRILESNNLNKRLIVEYNDFSRTYIKLGYTKEREIVLNNAKNLMQKNKAPVRTQMIVLNSLGLLYTEKNMYNYNESKLYYLKSLKLAKVKNHDNYLELIYNNLAYLYNIEKKDSAKHYIKMGLKLNPDKLTKARLHDNYSDYYLIRNDYKNALKYINQALFINLDYVITDNANLLSLRLSKNKDYSLYCLNRKAEILIKLYEKEKNKSYLTEAFNAIKYADNLIEIIQEDFSEEKNKLHWRKEASKIYAKGAYISFLLENVTDFFHYSEKNKTMLLTESILKNTSYTHLPKNIAKKEKKLKQLILKLENSDFRKTDKFQDSLFNAKIVYEKYYDSIKTEYPKFFKNNFQSKLSNLSEIQKGLDKNTIAISYISDEKEIILGTIITKQKTELFKIKSYKDFKINLQKYKQLISKPFETNDQRKEFEKISYQLFNQLLPIKNITSLLQNKQVIILPDSELQNLPFESLLINKKTNEYIISKSTLSYLYSFSFSKHNDSIRRKNSSNLVSYAPKVFFDDKLIKLNHSQEEVNSIGNLLSGDVYKDSVLKNVFFNSSKEAKIIHLATHANANKNPWVAFSDNKLNLHELYTYKNNADLVVISACNTSIGKIEKGEGAFSLARGFFYSGAKSVISSLWNVNDKSTSFIMTQFYKNIKSGQKKSEALTNAKREYLKTHSLASASPYYWASFVLIGNSDTIELSNSNLIYYLFLIIFILSIIILIKFQKK